VARPQFLGEIVADADRLLAQVRVARRTLAAGSVEAAALVAAAGLLSRVLCQDVERKDLGPAIQQGTAPDRVVSIHDPEMRHGRTRASKRFDGGGPLGDGRRRRGHGGATHHRRGRTRWERTR
jgi:hypothetical protein